MRADPWGDESRRRPDVATGAPRQAMTGQTAGEERLPVTAVADPRSAAVAPVGRARWVALAVVCAGSLMNVLDTTIVGVALPAIRHNLGFSQASLAGCPVPGRGADVSAEVPVGAPTGRRLW